MSHITDMTSSTLGENSWSLWCLLKDRRMGLLQAKEETAGWNTPCWDERVRRWKRTEYFLGIMSVRLKDWWEREQMAFTILEGWWEQPEDHYSISAASRHAAMNLLNCFMVLVGHIFCHSRALWICEWKTNICWFNFDMPWLAQWLGISNPPHD